MTTNSWTLASAASAESWAAASQEPPASELQPDVSAQQPPALPPASELQPDVSAQQPPAQPPASELQPDVSAQEPPAQLTEQPPQQPPRKHVVLRVQHLVGACEFQMILRVLGLSGARTLVFERREEQSTERSRA